MKNETGVHQTLGYIWWSQTAFFLALYYGSELPKAAGIGAMTGFGLLALNLLLAVGAALKKE